MRGKSSLMSNKTSDTQQIWTNLSKVCCVYSRCIKYRPNKPHQFVTKPNCSRYVTRQWCFSFGFLCIHPIQELLLLLRFYNTNKLIQKSFNSYFSRNLRLLRVNISLNATTAKRTLRSIFANHVQVTSAKTAKRRMKPKG